MADNTTLNAGTGGDVIASDDISGVKYQRNKIALGADGVNDGDVSSSNPLPVTGTITAVTSITNALPAGTNNIGDVDVLSLPAIPAGNNNIGDVDIASIAAGDNNIGNVDVVTLPSIPAGTNNIGDVDVLTLPSIPAGSNLIGSVNLQTNTGNGWTNFNATSGDGSTALTNTAQAVKASAGKVGGWYIYNPNSAVAYVILYNVAAASVTVGTTTPLMVIPVPGLSAANLEITHGINFGTAISMAATSTAAGNGAPTTALDVNLFYN